MQSGALLGCLIWILRMVSGSFASLASTSKEGTRCFCNEVSCVRTGYMCKSILGTCYSVVVPTSGGGGHGFRTTHGCADTLPETTQSACVSGSDENESAKDSSHHKIYCCNQDMCNYIDGASVVLLSAISQNGSSVKSSPAEDERPAVLPSGFEHSQQDLWFRVAVITVPLMGLFILILLVAAAVRMLRSDSRRHHDVGLHSRGVMAAVEWRFDNDPRKIRSQDRAVCGGLCVNHGYPQCWVDIPDQDCCNSKACKQQKCIVVSNCTRVYPVEKQTFINIEKCDVDRECLEEESTINSRAV